MNDRFKFRFWNSLSKQYENTYDLKSCEVLDYVIPEQCTGLKDKNGNLIYEGDIVEYSRMPRKGLVEWFKDGFWVNFFINGAKRELRDFHNWYEVIGNIHENPELLGESK